MHLDLVDVLRCPAPHADGWLVCVTQRVVGRRLLDGWLACPLCQAQFPVRDGIVHLAVDEAPRPTQTALSPHDSTSNDPHEPAPDDVIRLAAALDLTTPGRLVALAGHMTAYAAPLATLVPTRLVLLDGAAPPEVDAQPMVALTGTTGVPVAPGQLHAIACDAATATAERLAAAVQALAPGGRLVLPAAVSLPDEITPLVADAVLRVGVQPTARSAPVPLTRRRA